MNTLALLKAIADDKNRFLPSTTLAQTRIALVCNNASLTADGLPVRLALLQNGLNLVKLFSPEHGLSAAGEDGAFQQDDMDGLTGLPVISLYGKKLAPSSADLKDIDVVIFDIPDIGCRFYTYLWTMTHVMEVCAKANIPLIIADRPNPIGGDLTLAEGPMLDEKYCASFIGRWSIPVRHCCTMGELALYFKATRISQLQLQVVPAAGWLRRQSVDLPFTPTSPAIQRRSAALLYPGTGLLEGINVNEGRGTEMPFEICGAPWMDAHELHELFTSLHNPCVVSEPVIYTPAAGLYAGDVCNGLQFTVTNESCFRPVQTGITLIEAILQLYPALTRERLYPTVANPGGAGHLDKLLGIKNVFDKIKSGHLPDIDVSKTWQLTMKDYLLYE